MGKYIVFKYLKDFILKLYVSCFKVIRFSGTFYLCYYPEIFHQLQVVFKKLVSIYKLLQLDFFDKKRNPGDVLVGYLRFVYF